MYKTSTMKKINVLLIFFFSSLYLFSQNITGRLVDKATGKPIPYATVKTGLHTGVISNEEGYFTVNFEDSKNKTIVISCMGYKEKTLSILDIESLNAVIPLEESVNELQMVFISNTTPNADSIMAMVRKKVPTNYSNTLNTYRVFQRSTDWVNFKSLNFEIEKATHVKKQQLNAANTDLNGLSKKARESDMLQFTDFKGVFYNLDKDSSKLVVDKVTKLMDFKNDFSLDEVQEKGQNIMLKYLDTTKTYKLKTGIFKIEDSLSLKSDDFEKNMNYEFELDYLNGMTRGLVKHGQFYDNSFLNKILNPDYYTYTFINTTFNNNQLTYVISFTPRKAKAKFSGKLFVSDDSHAVTRIDYSYYKDRHGEKINLKLILGVKYIANLSEGLILFERGRDSIYFPKYIKQTTGSYFYVSRDLKFIENSETKNKIGFSIKIEGNNKSKVELLVTENSNLTLNDFAAIEQAKVAPFERLSKYEDRIWKNDETLEPLSEMKDFKVED